jgi:hypothetical protein
MGGRVEPHPQWAEPRARVRDHGARVARQKPSVEQRERTPPRREIALDVTFEPNEKVIEILLPLDGDQTRVAELCAKTSET